MCGQDRSFLNQQTIIQAWLKFAKNLPDPCGIILQSNDTKVEFFCHNSRRCAWCKKTNKKNPLWACFSSARARSLIRAEGLMNNSNYQLILAQNLKACAGKLEMKTSLNFSPWNQHRNGFNKARSRFWNGSRVSISIHWNICEVNWAGQHSANLTVRMLLQGRMAKYCQNNSRKRVGVVIKIQRCCSLC